MPSLSAGCSDSAHIVAVSDSMMLQLPQRSGVAIAAYAFRATFLSVTPPRKTETTVHYGPRGMSRCTCERNNEMTYFLVVPSGRLTSPQALSNRTDFGHRPCHDALDQIRLSLPHLQIITRSFLGGDLLSKGNRHMDAPRSLLERSYLALESSKCLHQVRIPHFRLFRTTNGLLLARTRRLLRDFECCYLFMHRVLVLVTSYRDSLQPRVCLLCAGKSILHACFKRLYFGLP